MESRAAEPKAKVAQRLYHHQHLPKPTKLEECYGIRESEQAPTTLMVRNVPNRYSPRELITDLEEIGFAGAFNFLYLPVDRRGWRGNGSGGGGKRAITSSIGYAFVNFIDATTAHKFMGAMQGYAFKGKNSSKVAAVSVAHIQGLQANLAHYENAAVNCGAPGQLDGPIFMPALAPALGAVTPCAVARPLEPAKVKTSAAMEQVEPPWEAPWLFQPAKVLLGYCRGQAECSEDVVAEPSTSAAPFSFWAVHGTASPN